MRTVLALLALVVALPAAAQAPNRFLTLGGNSWGYVQLQGAAVTFPDSVDPGPRGIGFRGGLDITILTRDGRPVTGADRDDARAAAAQICHATRRQFDPRVRGTLLRRGGLLFPGACG
jgi:hypothetical protein